MGLRTTKLAHVRSEIKAGYEAGGTMQDLAALYNTSVGTVRNELIAQGIQIRSRGRRKKAKVVDASKPEFKVSALAEQVVLAEEVPVEVTPDISVEALPVEQSENAGRTTDVNENLRVIFGEGEPV